MTGLTAVAARINPLLKRMLEKQGEHFRAGPTSSTRERVERAQCRLPVERSSSGHVARRRLVRCAIRSMRYPSEGITWLTRRRSDSELVAVLLHWKQLNPQDQASYAISFSTRPRAPSCTQPPG